MFSEFFGKMLFLNWWKLAPHISVLCDYIVACDLFAQTLAHVHVFRIMNCNSYQTAITSLKKEGYQYLTFFREIETENLFKPHNHLGLFNITKCINNLAGLSLYCNFGKKLFLVFSLLSIFIFVRQSFQALFSVFAAFSSRANVVMPIFYPLDRKRNEFWRNPALNLALNNLSSFKISKKTKVPFPSHNSWKAWYRTSPDTVLGLKGQCHVKSCWTVALGRWFGP